MDRPSRESPPKRRPWRAGGKTLTTSLSHISGVAGAPVDFREGKPAIADRSTEWLCVSGPRGAGRDLRLDGRQPIEVDTRPVYREEGCYSMEVAMSRSVLLVCCGAWMLWGCGRQPTPPAVPDKPPANAASPAPQAPPMPAAIVEGPAASRSAISPGSGEAPSSVASPTRKGREPIYDEMADAKALIAAAVKRAAIERKHVLIEWGGNWCGWCYRLHDVFHQDKTVSPIVHEEYELVLIDSNSNDELMKSYGGKDRQYSYPHLTILDAAGEVLTNQETGSLEIGPKHDPEKVAAFLKTWIPARLNAEQELTKALERAKAEDKSVFVQVGDPYCGWCKRLSAFLSEHEKPLSQDYVHLKIDTVRMTHGDEVALRLAPGTDLGHPWMVILDAEGKRLASSVGPEGSNIGHPSQPAEIDHFLAMLKGTRKRLTDSDLDAFGAELNAAREKHERKLRERAAK